MKTVRIYGTARNLSFAPSRDEGTEVWCANAPRTVSDRLKRNVGGEWTRWFNLHSKAHILGTYPSGWHFYQHGAVGRPIYMLKAHEEIATSVAFPGAAIQQAFAVDGRLIRYFTCSVCWLIAFAILEGFERIELWGFELRDTKPGSAFAWERPCVAYWIQQARDRGVDITYQIEIARLYEQGLLVPGDPTTYSGPLYGYDTKPEEGWDSLAGQFIESIHG